MGEKLFLLTFFIFFLFFNIIKKMMKWMDLLVAICAIAAINWGLVTALGINAVELITPEGTLLRMIREPAYLIIGAVGIIVLLSLFGLI